MKRIVFAYGIPFAKIWICRNCHCAFLCDGIILR